MDLQFVWGWQPALYLFLGGLGAGAFAVAACLFLLKKTENRKVLSIVSWASFGCLAVGLLLLLSELIFPLRGLMMWQSFSNLTSWMTIGAWLLFACVVVIFVTAVMLTDKLAKPLKLDGKDGAVRVLFVVGAVLSLGVAVYTGILLMSAPGVPLWNTLLIPCLFTVSALDTGVALNEIVYRAVEKKTDEQVHKPLVASTVVLIAVEAVVVIALLAVMASGAGYPMPSYALTAQMAAATLTGGSLAGWFWVVFVAIGLVVPVVCALAPRFMGKGKGAGAAAKADGAGTDGAAGADGAAAATGAAAAPAAVRAKGPALTYIGAAGVLVGGCALRFLILLAGVHADVMAVEVAKLLM